MSSVTQSQAGSSSRRNSASLAPIAVSNQPLPRILNSVGSEDEYAYQDTGPSVSLTNPKQRSRTPSTIDANEDSDRFPLDEVWTNLYEKEVHSSRAKIPDDFGPANGNSSVPQVPPIAQATTNSRIRNKKRRFFLPSRLPAGGSSPRSAEKTILRKIDLHWSRVEDDGVKKIMLKACIAHNEPSTGSENSILWQ